nr:hypothetical protein [uncultured Holophaga sp.]
MTSHLDPEYLLGGYATGTLTPDERRRLLEAALADQALFDALMDEEALHELLADPRTRKRLLKVLTPPVPFHRRPTVLGLAAVLLVAVGTTWVLHRTPVPEGVQPAPTLAPQTTETQEAAPLREPVRKPGKNPRPAPPAPLRSEPPPTGSTPLPPPAPAAGAADALSGPRSPTEGFRARSTGALSLPAPSLRLERTSEGCLVSWVGGGHLYVLHRRGDRVGLLVPILHSEGRAEFRFRLAAGEQVDVYLMAVPVADPTELPAEGPVEGLRERLR